MTNRQGTEALRLAEEITELMCSTEAAAKTIAAAADELCRLHVENARLATLVEAQQHAPSAAAAEIEALRALSVTNIMLDIVPGLDGMGHEVYAKSVKDVEDKLSAMGQELEDWQLGIRLYQPSLTPQADSVTAPAGGAAILKEILAAACCEDSETYLTNDQYRKLYDLQRRIESMPTPPTQAADSVLEDAGGASWQDISTAPKDGTRFVAVGQHYGLDSEKQHTCIAQWLAGCWVEVSDWNGASKLKYLTHWMPLPPLPGSAARKQGANHD